MSAEERKLATVLFADLVGSTELAGDEDPERIRALLDRFYDAMATEIERAEGTVEKFIGDAVMAAFGAPVAHEDDAERALHAALAMQRRFGELFGEQLALRIGVNTGDVVVGRPREGSSFVTGDTVNVCARLEQAAAPGEILVGERTAAAVRGAFEFGDLQTVEAKGKAGGVQCRRLLRPLTLMRPRGVTGGEAIFVGRDGELAELEAAYRQAVFDRTPCLVTVIGDAGVGKTRLMRELWQVLSDDGSRPLLRTGRCLAYGEGITYRPLAEVLREHFEILENDPAEVIEQRLGSREGLEFTLGLAPPAGLHPLIVRDRLHGAWVELLNELAADRPVVVLIEDLHWAEPELCGLLELLAERVRGSLLILGTARPEFLELQPAWPGRHVRLEALDALDALDLAECLLGANCPAPIRTLIVERSEGNPFYLEELIATLADRGVIVRANGGWSFGELPPGFSLPDTVQAVLAARIDLLPPVEKAALQAAAVIGRVFWASPVRALIDDSPDFALIEQREFIRSRAGSSIRGESEFAIKHALTREVAYESLLKAKRAPLHAGFAEWLDGHREGDDDHAALLAHHYAEAVRPEDLDLAWFGREDEAERLRQKALYWLSRAAELAVGRYEIDEGLALLERAVELEQDQTRQAGLWQRIARANVLKFDGDAFWRAMEKAIGLGGPQADLYAELAFQSTRRWGMWKRQPHAALISGWSERALDLAEEGSRNRALALYTHAAWHEDLAAARALAAVAEQRGEPDLEVLALEQLADRAWEAGNVAEARALIDRLAKLAPQLSDPDDQTRPLLDVVTMRIHFGDLAGAAAAAALNVELARGLTPHHRLHGVGSQVRVAAMAGRWDAVAELARHAERTVDDNADTPCPQNVTTLLHCALVSVLREDERDARRLEEKAAEMGMEGWRIWIDPPLIRLALARGDVEALPPLLEGPEPHVIEPPSAYLDALSALGEHDRIEAEAPKWLRAGTYAEPFALRALGVARNDQTLIRQAAATFVSLGMPWHAEQTKLLT